ncbi:TetR/AcrR family transcriptional regulator [Starkeya sp. ORNL1]|uniref:TetR/AcrR family transcriptional regulator n=1 Tax=Starkeya sp. ORNL1 TaxID=2709380 RepID=UPI0014643D90|nr:TetR/AcrR family transcriptional regulator [Starkeya sp. ORNL1]QJP12433.1 TetR/AcrR family transcriptional regulator [Starkeya sp. ORNL1]
MVKRGTTRSDQAGTAAERGRPAAASRPRARRLAPEARRRGILDAALIVFAENGYAGARMDDVAARAGVAKGTLYLYFEDKKALFEGLVHDAADPILGVIEQRVASFEGNTRELLATVFAHLAAQAVHSPRRHLIKLMMGEGERFPELADFYYREVVSRGIAVLRSINARALARGEITSDAGLRFPQLIMAPLLVAVMWESLFARNEPLDTSDMLMTHVDLVLRGLGWREP